MILVTLGTQKQPFTRLLDYIEKSNTKDEIIVQAGYTKYDSKKMKIIDFMSYDEMEKLVDKADVIITHGGTGSIIGPLKKGKKVIACSRLQKYGEHVDNHQEELVEIFTDKGFILEINDDISLDEVMKKIKKFKPKEYTSNTDQFKQNLKNEIDEAKPNKISTVLIKYSFIPFFFAIFYWFDFITRYLFARDSGVSMLSISPNLFTLSWICLLFVITLLLNNKYRKSFLLSLLVLSNVILFIMLIYGNMFNGVPSFKEFFLAKEGMEYAYDAILSLNIKHILIMIISIGSSFIAFKSLPYNKNNRKKIILSLLIVMICSYALSIYKLGDGPKESDWAVWNNKRYIYENQTDTKKAYALSGMYEYFKQNFYLTFLKNNNINRGEMISFVNDYIKDNPKVHIDNSYTGLFKDKNLIFVMMETIENWMITKENMPTLYQMRKDGINFTNHFSTNYTAGHTFNSEFIANTSILPFGEKDILNYAYSNNYYPYSMPQIFINDDYIVNSYHKNAGSFYSRESVHTNLGYEKYYNSGTLDITHGYWNFDSYLIKDGYSKIVSDDKFMSFIITYSAHMPYNFTKDECKENLDEVKKYIKSNNEEYLCAMAQSHETDNFFKELINKLTEDNKIDNTVIVAFTDHYAYGINKDLLYSLKKENDLNFMANTPFFIWAKDIELKEVTKVTANMDILPTIANLFGLEWNPNHYIGSDALNLNQKGLVIFKDYSWYDGQTYYKSNETSKTNEYINSVNKRVRDSIKLSESILTSDYFRYNQ